MDSTTYRKGDRVQVTATGRTANWPHTLKGTVEDTWQDRVYVRWEGTSFTSDEMTTDEVKKVSSASDDRDSWDDPLPDEMTEYDYIDHTGY